MESNILQWASNLELKDQTGVRTDEAQRTGFGNGEGCVRVWRPIECEGRTLKNLGREAQDEVGVAIMVDCEVAHESHVSLCCLSHQNYECASLV